MKKIMSWMLILCMAGLWGCGQKTDAAAGTGANLDAVAGTGTGTDAAAGTGTVVDAGTITGTATETTTGTATTTTGTAITAMSVPGGTSAYTTAQENRANYFEILDIKDKSILVCGLGETKGLYHVSFGEVQKGADGRDIPVSDLKAGMVVELIWNGNIQESYPGQFSYDELRVTGEDGSPEMSFYLQLIKDLAEADPGLNDGITECYFDLSGVDSLSPEEKEGLAYMAGSYFDVWGSLATEEELAESGVLDPLKGLEHGILVKVEETSNKNGTLTCNASKYRSGTGAYYFSDVKATLKDGRWSYEVGAHMIS